MSINGEKPVVVVTGAGSGIGYACAMLLLAKGYCVSAWDRDIGALAGGDHPSLSFHTLDVRDKPAMDAIVAHETGAGGEIVGLVACAAVFKRQPFLELDETTWDLTFDVNLKGSLFACQAVLPAMRRRHRGSIVLFSSSLARSGSATGGHYAATKGGLLGLARSLALEVAEEGIRVNVVSPGLTDTPQPRGHAGGEAAMFAKAKDIPLGRIGRAADIADATLFLLEDDSSFITGQDIRVNGGSQMF
jgi:NAD(P)-dependent dehydrogenase (short-subunit alcohol dehydrogenase family)